MHRWLVFRDVVVRFIVLFVVTRLRVEMGCCSGWSLCGLRKQRLLLLAIPDNSSSHTLHHACRINQFQAMEETDNREQSLSILKDCLLHSGSTAVSIDRYSPTPVHLSADSLIQAYVFYIPMHVDTLCRASQPCS